MKKIVYASFACAKYFTLILIIFGCAQYYVQQRIDEIENMMTPLLGKPKKDIILTIGQPTQIREIEGLEIYKYYISYGTKSGMVVIPGTYVASGSVKTWERYDLINVYFEGGKMVKWDCRVQR